MLKNQETDYYPNEIATLLQLSNCVVNQPDKLKVIDNKEKKLVLARRYPNIVCCALLLKALQKLGCDNTRTVFDHLVLAYKNNSELATQVNLRNVHLFTKTFNNNWNNTINCYVNLAKSSFPNVKVITTKDKSQLSETERQKIIALVITITLFTLAYYDPNADYHSNHIEQYDLAFWQSATLIIKFDVKPSAIFKDLKINPQGKKPFDVLPSNLDEFLTLFKKVTTDQSLLDSYHEMFN